MYLVLLALNQEPGAGPGTCSRSRNQEPGTRNFEIFLNIIVVALSYKFL
jgi:hypothetical protein